MKAKILQALKTKFKDLGFGEKAFEGVADYLATTVTDEANIETAISGVEPMLKSFQGEVDQRVTSAAAYGLCMVFLSTDSGFHDRYWVF